MFGSVNGEKWKYRNQCSLPHHKLSNGATTKKNRRHKEIDRPTEIVFRCRVVRQRPSRRFDNFSHHTTLRASECSLMASTRKWWLHAFAVMFNGPKIVYAAHGSIMSSDIYRTHHNTSCTRSLANEEKKMTETRRKSEIATMKRNHFKTKKYVHRAERSLRRIFYYFDRFNYEILWFIVGAIFFIAPPWGNQRKKMKKLNLS